MNLNEVREQDSLIEGIGLRVTCFRLSSLVHRLEQHMEASSSKEDSSRTKVHIRMLVLFIL